MKKAILAGLACLAITGCGNMTKGKAAAETQVAAFHQRFNANDLEGIVTAAHPDTMRRPIRISGQVIDARTKNPIRNVHVHANDVHDDDPRKVVSFTYPTVVAADGRYEVAFLDLEGMEELTWQLRVEAAGYVTQLSPLLKTLDGSQTLNFEMTPGKAVGGAVRWPDGSPVAGAMVFVSTAAEPWRVVDGEVDGNATASRACQRTGTDGHFALPRPLGPYVVGVVAESGGAEITAAELDDRGEIVLKPWARVEGVIERQPGESREDDEEVFLRRAGDWQGTLFTDKQDDRPGIDWYCSAIPEASGRFVIERVLPGPCEVEPLGTCFYALKGELVPY